MEQARGEAELFDRIERRSETASQPT